MNQITRSFNNLGSTDGIQSAALRYNELARDILSAGIARGDFLLSDGRATNYYFSRYSIFTKPTIIRRLAGLIADRLPGTTDRLAGDIDGSLMLAEAVSLHTGLPYVAVRRSQAGPANDLEGEIYQGETVVVIEDIISTGEHALEVVRKVKSIGASVPCVLAAIDRRDGAAAKLADEGVALDSLYTADDLIPSDDTVGSATRR